MTFNQALGSGNAVVSDKVKLSLDISAVKAAYRGLSPSAPDSRGLEREPVDLEVLRARQAGYERAAHRRSLEM